MPRKCLRFLIFPLGFLFSLGLLSAQTDSSLFAREEPIKLEMSYDFREMRRNQQDESYLSAQMRLQLDSATSFQDTIRVRARGNFRRSRCRYTPLKVDFRPAELQHPALDHLKSLKLVCPCQTGESYEQYLYQEYLVYQLYQLFTPMSFRVRMIELTLVDTRKDRRYELPAFFIEDVDDLAARNGCFELEAEKAGFEFVDQPQLNLMSMFEYMVGNTDWYMGNLHNLKLIRSNDVSDATVYPVPYDFDFTGLVDARYAIPNERLGTDDVRDRLYLGPCPDEDELDALIDIFKLKEEAVLAVYQNQSYLSAEQQSASLTYLEEFFRLLDRPQALRRMMQAKCVD